MADLPRDPDTDDVPDRESPLGTPRWVKIAGIIALVVVLLFVISHLAGVRHGPGMHTSSSGSGGQTMPTMVTVQSVQQP